MTDEELVEALRKMLPPQVDYAELVASPVPSSYGIRYVWEYEESYIINEAANRIEALIFESAEKDERIAALEADLLDYPHCKQVAEGQARWNQRLREQLAEAQRREQAVVEDITKMAKCKLLGTCTFCVHRDTPDARYKPCKGCIPENRSRKHFEWRGPQQDGKGKTE